MRITKRIGAALAALAMTAGLALADAFPPGAWLPITNITVNTDTTTVDLQWADFTGNSLGITGLSVYAASSLENAPQWNVLANYAALGIGGASFVENADMKFYRLYGATNSVSIIPAIWSGVGHTIEINLTTFATRRVANDAAVVADNFIYMRYINPGGFRMGTPAGEMGQTTQQKDVTLSGYYIGVYTVTEAQWNKVMGNGSISSNPKASMSYNMARGNVNSPDNTSTYSNPEYEIPASASGSFMARLRAGVQGANPGIKFDLPTEAQWEYACRAGTTGTFSDGNDLWPSTLTQAHKNRLSAIAYWGGTAENGGSAAHAVGALAPNAAGLYDMHGNVWEWCRDNWDAALPTGTGAGDLDPLRKGTGSNRSVRGGSWSYAAVYCRSANRSFSYSSGAYASYGFRLAAFGAVVP